MFLETELYFKVKDVYERIYENNQNKGSFEKCFIATYLFNKLDFKTYVDIGVRRGQCLYAVSSAVQENEGHAYGICVHSKDLEETIDTTQIVNQFENFNQVHEDIEVIGLELGFESIVTLIKSASDDVSNDMKDLSIDMLHLDGGCEHINVEKSIKKYAPLVSDGGIIVVEHVDQQCLRKAHEQVETDFSCVFESESYVILIKASKQDIVSACEKLISYGAIFLSRIKSNFALLDLVIVDDIFPYAMSVFRREEFEAYLNQFDDMRIYSNGGSLALVDAGKRNFDVVRDYKKKNPRNASKIIDWNDYLLPDTLAAKLAYFCFLRNAYLALPWVEKNNIPFVFELYPGGGFAFQDELSDRYLKTVFSSKCFCKVIVTQKIIYNYLIENQLCEDSQIILILGGITSIAKLEKPYTKIKRFGYEKSHVDICFVAMRYTRRGEDKGYDVFIAVAKMLCNKYDNIYFHIVGNFNEDVIDISEIKDKIFFYGVQDQDWFDDFYLDKDIILSPNIGDKIIPGAFDGFPTGCCIDAGLRMTAMFCTDELDQNEGRFQDKVEFVKIEYNIDSIVSEIEFYYKQPELLKNIGINGSIKIRQLYSRETQVEPRLKALKDEINAYNVNLFRIMHVNQQAYNSLLGQSMKMEQEHRDLQSISQNLNLKYEHLKNEMDMFQNENKVLEGYTKELQKEYHALEDYTKMLQKEYAKLEEYVKTLKIEYSNLEIGTKTLQKEYIALENYTKMLQKEYEILEKKYKKWV